MNRKSWLVAAVILVLILSNSAWTQQASHKILAPSFSNPTAPPITIDIMIVYTAQARSAAGGTAAMEAKLDQHIVDTNTAYVNSQINEQLRLVYRGEVSYPDSADMQLDLSRLQNKTDGFMDEVHSLRDQYGADLVCLYVKSGSYGGIAYLMTNVSNSFAGYAFSVVRSDMPGAVLAHETGHNMACHHDRQNAGGTVAYPYAYGYRWTGNSGTQWRTVMAYSPGARILYFSNPNVTYDGKPTGVDHNTDPNTSADNARVLNNTASTVAAFRASTTNSPPNIPSTPSGQTTGLAGTSYTYSTSTNDPEGNQVQYTFDWGDGNTTTTAFLASGATASSSHSWATTGTYSVKVQAKDSSGLASGWSSTLGVTISPQNVAPNTPSVPSGPSEILVGTNGTWSTSTTDPNGDQLQYVFDWGDGSTTTTASFASGATASASHSWAALGPYSVTVKAVDPLGLSSGWSSPFTVTAVFAAPLVTGPTAGNVNTSYSYSATATSPNTGKIKYTFNWGDGNTTTTALVQNGTTVTESHTWAAAGTYQVQVRAEDQTGAVSALYTLAVGIGSDLAVSDIWSPQQAEQGKAMTILEAISNREGSTASNFKITYTISNASTPAIEIGSRVISSLAGSSTEFAAVQLNIPSTLSDDNYTLTVTVDSGNSISESSETNNSFTRSIRITKYFKYDINGDDVISINDILSVVNGYGSSPGSLNFNPALDLNNDGPVTINDILTVVNYYGVIITKPIASLSASPLVVTTGQPVTLTYGFRETEAQIVSYELDYTNDGTYDKTSGTPGTVNYTYPSAGSYTAKLRVVDTKSQEATTTVIVKVVNFSTQAPTLTATKDTTYASVNLSWTGGSAPYWRVYRNTNSGTFNILANVTTTTYADNSTTSGNTYDYYVVGSKDSTGTSLGAKSNTATVPVSFTGPVLSLGSVTSTSVTIKWTPTPPAKASIERSLDGFAFQAIGTTATNGATSYQDMAVVSGLKYVFRIRFTDGAGKYGAYSGTVSATTSSATITLSRTSNTNNIVLSWSPAPTSPVTTSLEKSTNGGTSFSVMATVGGTTYTDQAVLPGTSYMYRARFNDGKGGYSAYSALVTGAPTGASPVISVTSMTDSSAAKITWSPANTTGVTVKIERSSDGGITFDEASNSSYKLLYNDSGHSHIEAELASTTATSYIDSEAVAGTTYVYRIRWSAAGLFTNYSSATWTSPASSTKPTLTATGIGPNSAVGFTWTPANPTAYQYASIEMKGPTDTSFTAPISNLGIAQIRAQLVAGTTYSFRMRFQNAASNPTGASVYSQTVNNSTPVPVLSATNAGAGSVTLGISGTTSPYFMIYRSTDGVNFTYVKYTATTTFTDTGLTSGLTYHYYVKSWSSGQKSNTTTITAQ